MSRRQTLALNKSAAEEPLVNLMPLIDVIFVVLVMFLIIAPMLDVDRVDLAEGYTVVKESELKNNVMVHVHADNSIWYNKREVNLNELQTLLFHEYQKNPGGSFQVFHDKSAAFGTYQDIRNVGQKAGFDTMDVILKPSR